MIPELQHIYVEMKARDIKWRIREDMRKIIQDSENTTLTEIDLKEYLVKRINLHLAYYLYKFLKENAYKKERPIITPKLLLRRVADMLNITVSLILLLTFLIFR